MIGKIKDWLNLGVLPLLGILIFTSFFIFLPEEKGDNKTFKLDGINVLFRLVEINLGIP